MSKCDYCGGSHANSKCLEANGILPKDAEIDLAKENLREIIKLHTTDTNYCNVCGVEAGRCPCETRMLAESALEQLVRYNP